jgi:hypothetical protein
MRVFARKPGTSGKKARGQWRVKSSGRRKGLRAGKREQGNFSQKTAPGPENQKTPPKNPERTEHDFANFYSKFLFQEENTKMRKYLAIAAAVALAAFAAPAFAAINPFMDVPINHWAYDAIGQLAARGVLSGYPDGTYKGKQPTTRYEMASALARGLSLVDMTKASKQDVEMLKKLVVEFKDELDALGARVDEFDERIGKFEKRLGGWQLSGSMRFEIFEDWDDESDKLQSGPVDRSRDRTSDTGTTEAGAMKPERYRIFLDRWFGEDEKVHFHARWNGTAPATDSLGGWHRFYVEFPGFWDTKMTVGRFAWYLESDYQWATGGASDLYNDGWFSDYAVDGIGFNKDIALGGVSLSATRRKYDGTNTAWELTGMAKLQFTEAFAFDIGVQGFLDSTDPNMSTGLTYWGGIRFGWKDHITLKGIYYGQNGINDENSNIADGDDGSAWKAIIDVRHGLLKFTNLWLEYSQLKAGFFTPWATGWGNLFLKDDTRWVGIKNPTATKPAATWDNGISINFLPVDVNIWRVGAKQPWNDKLSTWLYVSGFDFDVDEGDGKMMQYGAGVDYVYNAYVSFGLNYLGTSADDVMEYDPHRIQLRTVISF